ncbi:MAG: hypothetical protein HKM05_08520 [Spirochaetales bacterium]|nr:hypothetical protein [Spirochaetales bacterium]
MSTNPVSRSPLERLMDKAVRLAVSGRTEEAENLYAGVRQTEVENDADLYQVARAWVNSGILWDRQGLHEQAMAAWQKVLQWGKVSQSTLLQGAVFKAAEYLALRSPPGQRADVLLPYVRGALEASDASRHLPLWDLFAGAPDQPLGEAPPGESGLHANVPQLTRWSRLYFTQKKNPVPFDPTLTDLADFAVFYETLAPSLREFLWLREPLKAWCQALFASSFAPKPASLHELALVHSPIPSQVSPFKILRVIPPEIPFSSVRSLAPFQEGWTWVHDDGTVVWKTPLEQHVCPGTLHILRAVFADGVWSAQAGAPLAWYRLRQPYQVSWESPPPQKAPLPVWGGLASGKQGVWSWTLEGEIWFWHHQEPTPRRLGALDPGLWTQGAWSEEWGLVLGGQDGRLARWLDSGAVTDAVSGSASGTSVKAHRSAVAVILAASDHLISVSEDGQLLQWKATKGWQAVHERLLTKVTLGAVSGKRIVLAGPETCEVGDLETSQWTSAPANNPTAVALRADGVVLLGEARGCVVAENRLWGWSDWPVVLQDHGKQREWAAGGLDGSVRIVTWGKTPRLKSWGAEPVWGWKDWGRGVAIFSPFQLSVERQGQRITLLEVGAALTAWAVWKGWLVVSDWAGKVFAFSEDSLAEAWQLTLPEVPVALSGANDVLQVATRAGSFYHIEMKSGEAIRLYNWGKGPVSGVNWTDFWVAVWGPRGLPCLVLEAKTGRAVTEFEPTRGVAAVFWENERLWLAEGNGRLAVWDVENATRLQTLWEQGEVVRHFVGGARNIGVLTKGKRPGLVVRGGVAEFQWLGNHKRPLTMMTMTPAGDELWTAGEDKGIRRWRLPDGEPLGKIEVPGIVEHLAFPEENVAGGHQFVAYCRGGTIIAGSDRAEILQ